MITIQIDGQEFPLPDEIAAKDDLLRAALAPFVPWIANARIDRKDKDGAATVSVIKRADWKGNGKTVVDALIAAPEERNPAVALWSQIQGMVDPSDPGTILALEADITASIDAGEKEIAAVHQALTRLVECSPSPATRIPLGF
jgi:hypothetical protein